MRAGWLRRSRTRTRRRHLRWRPAYETTSLSTDRFRSPSHGSVRQARPRSGPCRIQGRGSFAGTIDRRVAPPPPSIAVERQVRDRDPGCSCREYWFCRSPYRTTITRNVSDYAVVFNRSAARSPDSSSTRGVPANSSPPE